MSDETTLLPCPFCGGEAAIYEEIPGGYIIQCHECCGQIGIMTKERAIAAWNTRAELGSDDEYETKMDALLCRLTNGKWSKSRAYDLDFMVSCVEEEFEAAEQENGTYKRIAELEQLIRNMYHEHPIYYFEQWMEDHGIEVER